MNGVAISFIGLYYSRFHPGMRALQIDPALKKSV